MSDDDGGEEETFEPDIPPGSAEVDGNASDLASREVGQFGRAQKSNTVVLNLGRGSYVSFNPESSVPIFGFLALVFLLLVVVLVTLLGIFIPVSPWMERFATALGHAITGVVGAIVGSATAKRK